MDARHFGYQVLDNNIIFNNLDGCLSLPPLLRDRGQNVPFVVFFT
jgi:hypothetical protein